MLAPHVEIVGHNALVFRLRSNGAGKRGDADNVGPRQCLNEGSRESAQVDSMEKKARRDYGPFGMESKGTHRKKCVHTASQCNRCRERGEVEKPRGTAQNGHGNDPVQKPARRESEQQGSRAQRREESPLPLGKPSFHDRPHQQPQDDGQW